jgi:uncharacterized protein with FMN-binding domain
MKKFLLSFTVVGSFIIQSLIVSKNQSATNYTASPEGQSVDINKQTPQAMGMAMQGGSMMASGNYKDGAYTGVVADAYYGNIQVQAVIQNGKITDVNFLQYPNDRRTSIEINTQAMPILRSEAIQVQSANVDIVSGATDSSIAFRQSLSSALNQAI